MDIRSKVYGCMESDSLVKYLWYLLVRIFHQLLNCQFQHEMHCYFHEKIVSHRSMNFLTFSFFSELRWKFPPQLEKQVENSEKLIFSYSFSFTYKVKHRLNRHFYNINSGVILILKKGGHRDGSGQVTHTSLVCVCNVKKLLIYAISKTEFYNWINCIQVSRILIFDNTKHQMYPHMIYISVTFPRIYLCIIFAV